MHDSAISVAVERNAARAGARTIASTARRWHHGRGQVTVHAFIDESRRGPLYLVAVAVADPAALTTLRREMRGLLQPGQRELHFKKESPRRRRMLADRMAGLSGVIVHVYARSCGRSDEPARQECLDRLTRDLLDLGAHRMVIDSREHRDANDRHTLRAVLGKRPSETHLTYEHVPQRARACCGSRTPWPGATARAATGASGLSRCSAGSASWTDSRQREARRTTVRTRTGLTYSDPPGRCDFIIARSRALTYSHTRASMPLRTTHSREIRTSRHARVLASDGLANAGDPGSDLRRSGATGSRRLVATGRRGSAVRATIGGLSGEAARPVSSASHRPRVPTVFR